MKNYPYLLMIIFWIYMFIAQIYMLYFWYEWSQDHSFLNTLIIGPFVAEFKGLLFPFFM